MSRSVCLHEVKIPLTPEEYLVIRDIAFRNRVTISSLMRLGALSAGLTTETKLNDLLRQMQKKPVKDLRRWRSRWVGAVLGALRAGPLLYVDMERQLIQNNAKCPLRDIRREVRRAVKRLLDTGRIRRRDGMIEIGHS